MSDKQEKKTSESLDGFSGQAARRKFIKNSGGLVVAAPAAVLLLSAASRSTIAEAASGSGRQSAPNSGDSTPKKNILDP